MAIHCRRCGRCCITAGCIMQASPGDFLRWEREGRQDILQHVQRTPRHYDEKWRDPQTGEPHDCCPWLRSDGKDKFSCAIHDTRPAACAEFSCILCEEAPDPRLGEEVVFGLWDFIVGEEAACPRCGKRGICRNHHFISLAWLKRQISQYTGQG